MTDNKKPLDDDQSSASAPKSASATSAISYKTDSTDTASANQKTVDKKTTDKPSASSTTSKTVKATASPASKTVNPEKTKQKISKTAMLALLIALIAIGASGVTYVWLEQQRQVLAKNFDARLQEHNSQNQQKINQLLLQQESTFSKQLNQILVQTQTQNEQKLTQLQAAISRLETNKPNDWLVNEAEYLIRIAARTLWLESDTLAAINLLKDADSRLATLDDPEFLPIRQLIHHDIEALELMPILNTENVVLTLMGLNQQLPSLVLKKHQADEQVTQTHDLELSSDISDWKSNLSKTWQNFLETFVVIHVRDGSAKPLLTPQYQQNLKENISLKIQQAEWAAREANAELYVQTLNEIQTWFNDYFDMNLTKNQLFIEKIEKLKGELISYDYPNNLSSLDAIRQYLRDRPSNYEALPVAAPTLIENEIDDVLSDEAQINEDETQLNNESTSKNSMEADAKSSAQTTESATDTVAPTAELSIEEKLHQQRTKQESIDKQNQENLDQQQQADGGNL